MVPDNILCHLMSNETFNKSFLHLVTIVFISIIMWSFLQIFLGFLLNFLCLLLIIPVKNNLGLWFESIGHVFHGCLEKISSNVLINVCNYIFLLLSLGK